MEGVVTLWSLNLQLYSASGWIDFDFVILCYEPKSKIDDYFVSQWSVEQKKGWFVDKSQVFDIIL